MKMQLPPPRTIKTTLFTIPAREAPTRKKQAREPERTSLNLTEYVVLHLYPNGTGGGESPLKDSSFERLEELARERLGKLSADMKFIERWLSAEKTGRVELRA